MGCEERAFGLLIKNRRKEMGLSQKDLAGRLGYKKTVKGIRRIEQFEEGTIVENMVEKVMSILGLRDEDRAVCKEEDVQRRWEYMVANPVTPHVVVRLVAAVHLKKEVPEDATVLGKNAAMASRFLKEALDDGVIVIQDESVGTRSRSYQPYWAGISED